MTAPAHVLVFRPIIGPAGSAATRSTVTARDYAQTLELLELHGMEHTRSAATAGASRARKVASLCRADARMRALRAPRRLRARPRARVERPGARGRLARDPGREHVRLRVRTLSSTTSAAGWRAA